jgi:hypothetical protein
MTDSARTAKIKAWTRVVLLGIGKWPLKILALFVVPFLNDHKRKHHSVWGARDATDLSWKNIAVTNGVHNLTDRPQVEYKSYGQNTADKTMEKIKGVQYRWRSSKDGKYVSYRRTWGKPRDKKGKREFYIGWTMNETATMRLTFFQFRPF